MIRTGVHRMMMMMVVVVVVVVLLATCCLLAVNAVAAAQPAMILVGSDQHYTAEVNGKIHRATIAVVCDTPLQSREKGYPLADQSVSVELSTGGRGYTGSAATSIVAHMASGTLTFAQYGSQTLPSSLALPCQGTGTALFAPQPSSVTARSSTVAVSYAAVLLLTESDSGKSYHLQKGGGLEVQLTGPASGVMWSEPVSSDPAVLEVTGGSSGTTATATLAALTKGTAQVTATGTFPCSQICAQPIVEFQVKVSVAG